MNAKKIISMLLCVCMMMGLLVVAAQAANPTITFDDLSKRTNVGNLIQVWEENGIKVTNEKGKSTSNINPSYYDPMRCYQNSNIIVEYTQNIEKIIFNCNDYKPEYTTALAAAITGATVAVDGTVVTATLNTPATSFKVENLGKQVRINSIEIIPGEGSNPGGGSTPDPDPTPVAPTDPKEIVDAAFALEPGKALPYEATLTGKIIEVNNAFDSQWNNVTVTIEVEGTTETKALKCYRLKGTGADVIGVGDTITVKGTIKNYEHSSGDTEVEFDAGCQLVSYTKGEGSEPAPEVDPEVKAILDAAYALEEGAQMDEDVSLTGKVTKIDTPYSEQFNNISVTIEIPGAADQPILCYRMVGEEIEKIAVGDTITVTGRIKNHYGTIEFAQGCSMDDRIPGENEAPVVPEDPKEIVDAAFALDKGASLPYEATLTGTVTEIVTEYSEDYKNITVNIEVEGSDGKKTIECYRMKGEGAENLKVGDIISVTGQLTRFYRDATEEKPVLDKIEFNSGCTFVPYVAEEGGDDTTGDDTTGDDNTNQPPQTSDITMIAVMIVAVLSATAVAVMVIGKKKLI